MTRGGLTCALFLAALTANRRVLPSSTTRRQPCEPDCACLAGGDDVIAAAAVSRDRLCVRSAEVARLSASRLGPDSRLRRR